MPTVNKLNFNDDVVLSSYIKGLVNDSIFHPNYEDNVDQARQMGVHLKGDMPLDLLNTYRPNEPQAIYQYRQEIYEPTTESEGKRIINVLSKIQQSSNYSISFEDQKNVPETETLKQYTTKDYPQFGSLTSWAFNVALKSDLIDANSLVVVKPLIIPDNETSYLKPFTFIYRSDQLLDYGHNYYTILLDEKNVVKDVPLKIWEVVTDTEILRIMQTNPSNPGVVSIEVEFTHNFGEPPAYFLGGDYREETVPFAFDSYVSGILPFWNKAVRMESDLDAQYVNHNYLERVEVEVECDAGCQNIDGVYGEMREKNTRLSNGEEIFVTCKRCAGSGFVNGRSPMGVTTVRKDAFEGANGGMEFPGVAYIEKPIDIVELQEKKIDLLISKGFSSINMDIIDKVGENQSGKAKDIDRTELSSFLNKVADNMFDNILKNAFKYIAMWRFSVINDVVLPIINKPTTFNALNESLLVDEIKTLNEAGINTTQFELDLIAKKFPNDMAKQMFMKNIIELDPLSGKTEEEKANIVLTGGATREQFIISSNIRGFILDAMEKNEGFLEESRESKMKKLVELAKKQLVLPIDLSNGTTEENTKPTE